MEYQQDKTSSLHGETVAGGRRRGFSVVEIILAAALFIVFATGAIVAALGGVELNRTGKEQSIATSFATEGIEALRSIRNQDYNFLSNTTAAGVVQSAGVWAVSGTNNTFDKYTRTLTIGDVYRDGTGNIVASGGTLDPDTKIATSTVTWNVTAGRQNTVSFSAYFTNWRKAIDNDSFLQVITSGVEAQ